MISCLDDNYIGIKDISEFADPTSGLFINEIDGITTEQLDSIRDEENHYEEEDAWTEIYNRALSLLYIDIKSYMQKYFKKYSYVTNGNTAVLRNKEAASTAARYGGYYFNFLNLSPNLSLELNSIDVYLDAATTFDVLIIDATTGLTIETITHEGKKGQNNVVINKKYPFHRYQRIFIAIDGSSIEGLKYYKFASDPVIWPSFKQVDKNKDAVQENFTSDDPFFALKYNVICDIDNFVCQRIDLFTYIFLYKLGIEFYKERLGSDRFNRYTLLDRETTVEKMDDLKKEYDKMMHNALKDTRLDYDGVCFECSDKFNKKFNIP